MGIYVVLRSQRKYNPHLVSIELKNQIIRVFGEPQTQPSITFIRSRTHNDNNENAIKYLKMLKIEGKHMKITADVTTSCYQIFILLPRASVIP